MAINKFATPMAMIARGAKSKAKTINRLLPQYDRTQLWGISNFISSDFPTPATGFATDFTNGIVTVSTPASPYTDRYVWKTIDAEDITAGLAPATSVWTPVSGDTYAQFEFLGEPPILNTMVLKPYGSGIQYAPEQHWVEGSNDGVNFDVISDTFILPASTAIAEPVLIFRDINPNQLAYKFIRVRLSGGSRQSASYQYIGDIRLH